MTRPKSAALALAFLVAAWSHPASAHDVGTAYLSISETRDEVFEVVWKVPAVPAGALALDPLFSGRCTPLDTPRGESVPGAVIWRWGIHCPNGLGETVGVTGLNRTISGAFIRIEWLDQRQVEGVVTGAEPSLWIMQEQPPALIAYVGIGVSHILEGLDHLSFVVALMLVVVGWKRLFATLTAFTIAHSLTLGASAMGWIGLPQRPVEAVIAFSIAVAAREAFLVGRGGAGVVAASPWAMAFGFGLLHGFGFANALAQIGLPQNAKLGALLAFNFGVEAGQVLVTAVLAPGLFAMHRLLPGYRAKLTQGVSVVLGAAAIYWLCERLFI